MGINNLGGDIKQLTQQLLQLTRDSCWNTLSEEVTYILSEINNEAGGWKERIEKRRSKDAKETVSFEVMITELEKIYPALHDINLYVHRAEMHRTIIDVQYYLKMNAGNDEEPNSPPMLHAKVTLPPYRKDSSEKFDVHWEFGGLKHRWRMFLGRLELRMKNLLRTYGWLP